MKTAKLTIRLPQDELAFARDYAREHGFSLTALVERYFSRLIAAEAGASPPEVKKVAGIVPAEIDAKAEYRARMLGKHL